MPPSPVVSAADAARAGIAVSAIQAISVLPAPCASAAGQMLLEASRNQA